MSSSRLTWTLFLALLVAAGWWTVPSPRPLSPTGSPEVAAGKRASPAPDERRRTPRERRRAPGDDDGRRTPPSKERAPSDGADVFASADACRIAVSSGERLTRDAKRARFASWNLRWFPDGAPGVVEPGTDIFWLACVLTWLDADVIAVQEVKQTPKAERAQTALLRELNRASARRYHMELDDCGSRVPQHVGLIFDEARVRRLEVTTVPELNPSGAACERQLRPGLAGRFVFPGGLDLSVVSVHFKSHADERSLALREATFAAVPGVMRRAEQASRDSDWLLLGDLNTMGCESCEPVVKAADELTAATRALAAAGLRLLPADAGGTELHRGRYVWLDHAVASMRMRELSASATVHVAGPCGLRGPPPSKLPLSDHCPLVLDLTDADLD